MIAMNSFLQTILIILLVYYGLKIVFKFFKPYLIKYIAKKASDRFGQPFGNDPFNNTSRKKCNSTLLNSRGGSLCNGFTYRDYRAENGLVYSAVKDSNTHCI